MFESHVTQRGIYSMHIYIYHPLIMFIRTTIFHYSSKYDNIPNLYRSCKQHIMFAFSKKDIWILEAFFGHTKRFRNMSLISCFFTAVSDIQPLTCLWSAMCIGNKQSSQQSFNTCRGVTTGVHYIHHSHADSLVGMLSLTEQGQKTDYL